MSFSSSLSEVSGTSFFISTVISTSFLEPSLKSIVALTIFVVSLLVSTSSSAFMLAPSGRFLTALE